jgi:hypothetical protein
MKSSCALRRKLAEEFATAARLYAESAIRLACSGKSAVDYAYLRDQTIEAQGRSEVAFKGFNEHVASHRCGEGTRNGNVHLNAQEQHVS